MRFTFDLFKNLSIITLYLVCVSDLDLSIFGCVKLKILRLMCRFTVAEGELRKPKKVEGRCEFFCSGSRNEKKVKAFLLTVYVS